MVSALDMGISGGEGAGFVPGHATDGGGAPDGIKARSRGSSEVRY